MISLEDAKKFAETYRKLDAEELKFHLKAMGTYSNTINAEAFLQIFKRLNDLEDAVNNIGTIVHGLDIRFQKEDKTKMTEENRRL